jgi:hypothetical protein
MAKSVLPTAGIKKIHGKAIKVSAWIVYVLAIADATLLTATFLGDWYRKAIGALPTAWTIGVTLIAGVIMLILALVDVLKDLEPNMKAIYCTLLLPTVVSAMSGGFADWINGGADWVFGLVDQWLAKSVPNGLGTGNDLWAIALTVAVVMLAQRFNKKEAKS